ncbi:hypothetical protein M405DRAFT_824005 [Rhizopogon salebrosus TDB-379]|nr:hypothetical protein M405DRAFT_824005 [Rhizopogon salebrosus TDB-379]
MSIQHPRQETIDELRKLVYQAVYEFGNRNKACPVFRKEKEFKHKNKKGEYNLFYS